MNRKINDTVGVSQIPASLGTVLFLALSLACAQTSSSHATQTRARRVSPTNARSITLPANGNLQEALDAAQYGDTIILQAGAAYESPGAGSQRDYGFSFPYKGPGTGTNADYITIRTSDLRGLPGDGLRVSPAHARSMAYIVANAAPTAVSFAPKAHHYRFVGIAFTNKADTGVHTHSLAAGLNPYGQHNSNIEFDRCLFFPIEETIDSKTLLRSVTRGVWIDGARITLKNSYVYGFTGRYKYGPQEIIDSECLLTVSGPGPYYIVNNFLEAWFNNIFTGGGGTATLNTATVESGATLTSATLSQSANLEVGDYVTFKQPSGPNANGRVLTKTGNSITFTPLHQYGGTAAPPAPGSTAGWNGLTISNIEIRRNTFHKRPEWANAGLGNPKGYMEIKTAEGLIIDGNIFQGAQSTIGISARNQDGSTPWTTVKDVTITNNLITNYSTAIILLLHDNYHRNEPGGNVVVANNLFRSEGDPANGTRFMYLSGASNVEIAHNTIFDNSNSIIISDGRTTGVVFRDNIVSSGEYVMICTLPNGPQSCWPSLVVARNLIIDTRSERSYPMSTQYRQNNHVVSNLSGAGFVDFARGNYRLLDKSRYKKTGTNGKDPGVDFDSFDKAISTAEGSF